jgi:hypothetical protein
VFERSIRDFFEGQKFWLMMVFAFFLDAVCWGFLACWRAFLPDLGRRTWCLGRLFGGLECLGW